MKNEEYSDEKLNELLKKSSSIQPFNIPDGYFENLSDNIMSSITAIPDFEKQSAVQPFEVPANYFEDLPSTINNRILASKSTKFSIWKLFTPTRTVFAAFSIALISIGYFYINRDQNIDVNPTTCTVDEINESTYLQSVSDDDLIDFLASQQGESSTDEYDQYLLDNDVDISQLEKNL